MLAEGQKGQAGSSDDTDGMKDNYESPKFFVGDANSPREEGPMQP